MVNFTTVQSPVNPLLLKIFALSMIYHTNSQNKLLSINIFKRLNVHIPDILTIPYTFYPKAEMMSNCNIKCTDLEIKQTR